MSFIYKITNKINNKVYVGKTNTDIEKRFRQHISDSQRERCKDRPLYRAMNKYGTDNFDIELLEEVSYLDSSKKEIEYIENLNAFSVGYNATKGGDGTYYLDYEKIISTYSKVKSLKVTAEICECHIDSVKSTLNNFDIPLIKEVNTPKSVISVIGEKNGEIFKFESIRKASEFLVMTLNLGTSPRLYTGHICSCCKGRRKTCKGFKWSYC